jgi:anaerobic magnesium-protoporphyrin IX monomethyl ester cyclase
MTRILFGQSYFLRFDPKLWKAMQPYPPLGTMYAASYLRARGYDVALFDAMLASSEDEWAEALDVHRPEFAVLYEDNFNYLSKMCLLRMRQAAFLMMGIAEERGCIVIAAGADVTDHADLYLKQGADYVILGEGEETLGELMDVLTGRSTAAPESVVGVASRRNGRAARRPDIHNLDSLPFPAW